MLFITVYWNSTSLAMQSNVIRELCNNSLIMKLLVILYYVYWLLHSTACMPPGFLEVAQHQLVITLVILKMNWYVYTLPFIVLFLSFTFIAPQKTTSETSTELSFKEDTTTATTTDTG